MVPDGQKVWTDRRMDDAKTISLRLHQGINMGKIVRNDFEIWPAVTTEFVLFLVLFFICHAQV